MPSWDEYRAIAKGRGALAFELFVVESKPADPDVMAKTLPDHLEYQKQLEADGQLFLAGPLSDEAGLQMSGGGLIVYRAQTMEDARALAQNDPMHANGGRTFALRKWLVNEGGFTINLGLAAQSVKLT